MPRTKQASRKFTVYTDFERQLINEYKEEYFQDLDKLAMELGVRPRTMADELKIKHNVMPSDEVIRVRQLRKLAIGC
jgi:hypothetical protein